MKNVPMALEQSELKGIPKHHQYDVTGVSCHLYPCQGSDVASVWMRYVSQAAFGAPGPKVRVHQTLPKAAQTMEGLEASSSSPFPCELQVLNTSCEFRLLSCLIAFSSVRKDRNRKRKTPFRPELV